jgi:hypothetical protein
MALGACNATDGPGAPMTSTAPPPHTGAPSPDDAGAPAPRDAGQAAPDSGSVVVSCGRAPGACVNTGDCGTSRAEMARKVGECGRRCLGAASCTATCMKDGLSLSQNCAECWGAVVQCGRDKCLTVCAAGTDSPDCRDCTVSSGCDATFARCSGL